MKTLVITGGTDGIGKALALTYLRRGDIVVIVGRSAKKGEALLADPANANSRAVFLRADLSLVSENRRIIDVIGKRFPTVDVLLLCARYFRSIRKETEEGLEDTFATFFLSRHVLSYGLLECLKRSDGPVIVNVAGPGHEIGAVQWDDLQLERHYHGVEALMQSGRLNDLLGIGFAATHGAEGIKYVLINPGTVSTSFAGEYDQATAAIIENMKKAGKPVAEAIPAIVTCIDFPPTESLSAFVEGGSISMQHPSWSKETARKLRDSVNVLLSSR